MADIIFADGMYYEEPRANTPKWIKGKIAIRVHEFIPFLEEHINGGGYVNLDIKVAKSGKTYISLNDYKKGTLRAPSEDEIAMSVPPIDLQSEPEQETDDIPF